MDQKGRLITDQVVQCSYMGGIYQLQSFPDRIDLKANTPNVMPPTLVETVESIVEQLEAAKRSISISGFGMNCDALVARNLLSTDGLEFCFRLSNKKFLNEIIGEQAIHFIPRAQFMKDPVRYDIRIEPHFQTQGSNLFVAVNGHQNISDMELLNEAMKYTDSFRKYVEELHRSITTKR